MDYNKDAMTKLIQESVKKTFEDTFPRKEQSTVPLIETVKKPNLIEKIVEKVKTVISEAVFITPRGWNLKTERLSNKTKTSHVKIYKDHVEATNKINIRLDSVNREVSDSDHSAFRSLKNDEVENKNSVILHELYFGNISDSMSEIHVDSLAFMRLARDWGSFDNWQFDFMASCLASREGWAICYLDTFKNKYMNCVIDGDSYNVPLGGIPIIAMDMHSHAYFYDYISDKQKYVTAMLTELAWNVIEARIILAERANLHNLFAIIPPQAEDVEKLIPNIPQHQPASSSPFNIAAGIDNKEEEKEETNNKNVSPMKEPI